MREGTGRRRIAAGLSLLATAAGTAWLGVRHIDWIDWHTLAFAGGLAAAAVGLTRKNLGAQILSRATAWIVLAPTAAITTIEALRGHADLTTGAFALTSGAALVLALPMLRTPEARASFHPSKFRRSFLAACTVASTIAILVGIAAYEALRSGEVAGGFGLGVLGVSILASAMGVLRMRGWGIALAALGSFASLVAAAFVGAAGGVALAATALPGLLLLLPVVLAKLGLGEDAPGPLPSAHVRVFSEEVEPAMRVRVASERDDIDSADVNAPHQAALRADA